MILAAVAEARTAGARLEKCADLVEIDTRTLQRWADNPDGEDGRKGPKSEPHNKLTNKEREDVLELLNSPGFRDLSPNQIVPLLADEGRYIASEATMYRILREEELNAHRGRDKPRHSAPPSEFKATGPNQVWSWDISYLKSPHPGVFYYLYMVVDVWSRKVVGWCVHDRECGKLASELVIATVKAEKVDPETLVLHQDNGGPMKGATLKATLEALGVMASYSRPRVSDDNPFSESLFRTLKYRPEYPKKPFESLEHARRWVGEFVAWYNLEHLHSAIGFVTPMQRHEGKDTLILARRRLVYAAARKRHPHRWTTGTRAWSRPDTVTLNPARLTKHTQETDGASKEAA